MIKVIARVKKAHLKFGKMDVFEGCITVYNDKTYLWSKYTGITRLNPQDARSDAKKLKSDTMVDMILNQIDESTGE